MELPYIMDDPDPDAVRPTRSADQIYTDKEKTGLVIDSTSATAIIVGKPNPNTDQIMEDDYLAFISFWSTLSAIELSVGISGKHTARFVARVTRNGVVNYVESDIIGGRQNYFVCTVFDRNRCNVIINGIITITFSLDETIIFDRTYIGSSHTIGGGNLDGFITHFLVFSTPLLYPRILQLYREHCPDNAHHTYEYMRRYFRYSLTTDSEMATYNLCQEDPGYNYFVSQLKFSLPDIFEQFPPGKKFKEEEVRDHVRATMRSPERKVVRESFSNIGRTDLTLCYSAAEKHGVHEVTERIERNYRMEFKIWGRSGYKDAPSQPLKYMAEDELVGAFIMIDRRKTPSFTDFENVVRTNRKFPCISVTEISLIDFDLKYFVSFHRDGRYKMLRMMLNIYLPIAE